MNLVVQDVGEQSDVQVAVLILEAHHAVVVLVELSGQLLIGQADAALHGGLAGVLHQNGSALEELGEPVGAVLVHHVVTLVDIGGVDQGVVGIYHPAQEVGTLIAGGDLHAQLLHEGRSAGDVIVAVAHVRRTGLHGGQGIVAEGAGAHDDVGLDGKAHGGQSQPVEAVVIGAGAQGGLHVAGGVVGGLAGQVHLGIEDTPLLLSYFSLPYPQNILLPKNADSHICISGWHAGQISSGCFFLLSTP